MKPSELEKIERHLHLHCNKWDTQVADKRVLHEQPLLMPLMEWDFLCSAAEQLAAEVVQSEIAVLRTDSNQRILGIPRSVWEIAALRAMPKDLLATRAMRFDFHPTAEGWCVSEVNSDVPGGWLEASMLPILYHDFYDSVGIPPSPLNAWVKSLSHAVDGGQVALLSAPGFLEDQQVVFTFMRALRSEGIPCVAIHRPESLDWSGRKDCVLKGRNERVSAVVRFYQIEWLCALAAETGWKDLLSTATTPVVNPTVSAISESKRFSLCFDSSPQDTVWSTFFPECRDPRDIKEGEWDDWVLKAAYSNAGDEVHICCELPPKYRQKVIRRARRNPFGWVAQRGFKTMSLESERGLLYPCIGMFVVDGKAAGAYVRLSSGKVTDGAAMETPLFINDHGFERMTKDEVYSIWNATESVWTRWTKSVLFSYLQDGELQTTPVALPHWQVQTLTDAAVLADVPGEQGVLIGLRLCMDAGFRPIPIYNACPFASFDSLTGARSILPLVTAAVDLVPLMHGLVDAADLLRNAKLPSTAPPAFLVDSNRNSRVDALQPSEGWFDNRSFVTISDFPSASFLKDHSLLSVILIQAEHSKIRPDVEGVLLSWQDSGIAILRQAPMTDWNPKLVRLRHASLIRLVWRRFIRIAGYRKNDGGWFGKTVPPSSS